MSDDLEYYDALAALEWQVELGADEAIGDLPVDRFDLPAPAPIPVLTPVVKPAPTSGPTAAPVRHIVPDVDRVAIARQLAESAGSIEVLRAAMEGFEHCDLKRGARNFVFSDGYPSARVMVVGAAPGRDEDRHGAPFAGAEGHLLDKMFAAIGLDRTAEGAGGLYLTDMLPWRPPQDRDPRPDELAMIAPFVRRHIELAAPDIVVLMGNHACAGLLGRHGIKRMRGEWEDSLPCAALPMFHPKSLLKAPLLKREAWADLLSIKARLGANDD